MLGVLKFNLKRAVILSDAAQQKLSGSNVFLIAKRNVEGQVCL